MAKGGGKTKKARRGAGKSAESLAPAKIAKPGAAKAKAAKKSKSAKVARVVTGAKAAAGKISQNPMVAEVVAAALVATAAALRNPGQARRMASDAASELEGAMKDGAQKTSAFWQLALDVARRSIETLEAETRTGSSPGKSGSRKKAS